MGERWHMRYAQVSLVISVFWSIVLWEWSNERNCIVECNLDIYYPDKYIYFFNFLYLDKYIWFYLMISINNYLNHTWVSILHARYRTIWYQFNNFRSCVFNNFRCVFTMVCAKNLQYFVILKFLNWNFTNLSKSLNIKTETKLEFCLDARQPWSASQYSGSPNISLSWGNNISCSSLAAILHFMTQDHLLSEGHHFLFVCRLLWWYRWIWEQQVPKYMQVCIRPVTVRQGKIDNMLLSLNSLAYPVVGFILYMYCILWCIILCRPHCLFKPVVDY